MSGATLVIVLLSLAGAYLILLESQSSGEGESAGSMTHQGHCGWLTAAQIAPFAARAGFSGDNLVTAVAIALAESGGDPKAQGDLNLVSVGKGPSLGLWQINVGSHPEYACTDLFDPQANANIAFFFFTKRRGFGDWSTFTGWTANGVHHDPTYVNHLAEAQTAIDNLSAAPPVPQGGSPCAPCILGGEG